MRQLQSTKEDKIRDLFLHWRRHLLVKKVYFWCTLFICFRICLSTLSGVFHEYQVLLCLKHLWHLPNATEAINEMIKELESKPIKIEVLNTRVDTARDLTLKLYKTTNDYGYSVQVIFMINKVLWSIKT